MTSFKLAIGQSPAELASPQDRLAWLAEVLASVADQRADLLLLPELYACGYNIGAAVAQLAEPSDGPQAAAIRMLAAAHGVAIHYGYAERSGAQIYNSAQCFGPDGALLGHQRKLVIPPGYERGQFVAGQKANLFTYRGMTIATLICYDAEFPETVRHVAARGAELVLVPTALGAQWGWVSRTMIPTRAYENGVFLAYANSAGIENGMAFLGESVVAAPDGSEVARAGAGPEILFAVLDPARIGAAQARLPYLQDRMTLDL